MGNGGRHLLGSKALLYFPREIGGLGLKLAKIKAAGNFARMKVVRNMTERFFYKALHGDIDLDVRDFDDFLSHGRTHLSQKTTLLKVPLCKTNTFQCKTLELCPQSSKHLYLFLPG